MSAPRALDNSNPTVLASSSKPTRRGGQIGDLKGKKAVKALWQEEDGFEGGLEADDDEDEEEQIDAQEVYDLLRSITDPEHPLTLEQLAVVTLDQIKVSKNHVLVELTPTIPHCSMATLIGLSLRVRLLRSLPPRYKVDLRIKAGTHQSEHAVNKQLNDKERVQAALENRHLLDVVEGCLASAGQRGGPLQTGAAGLALHA